MQKKLLTLVLLWASVALLAGCVSNQETVEVTEEVVETPAVVVPEVVAPEVTVEEVAVEEVAVEETTTGEIAE